MYMYVLVLCFVVLCLLISISEDKAHFLTALINTYMYIHIHVHVHVHVLHFIDYFDQCMYMCTCILYMYTVYVNGMLSIFLFTAMLLFRESIASKAMGTYTGSCTMYMYMYMYIH